MSKIKTCNNKTLKISPKYALSWAVFNRLFSCFSVEKFEIFCNKHEDRL